MTTSSKTTTSDDDDEHHRAAGVGTVMLAVPSKKVLRALSFVVERCDNMCVLDWKEAPSPFLCDVFSLNVFLSLSLSLSFCDDDDDDNNACADQRGEYYSLSLSLTHLF